MKMASKIAAAATVRAVKFKRPLPTRAALVLVSKIIFLELFTAFMFGFHGRLNRKFENILIKKIILGC